MKRRRGISRRKALNQAIRLRMIAYAFMSRRALLAIHSIAGDMATAYGCDAPNINEVRKALNLISDKQFRRRR